MKTTKKLLCLLFALLCFNMYAEKNVVLKMDDVVQKSLSISSLQSITFPQSGKVSVNANTGEREVYDLDATSSILFLEDIPNGIESTLAFANAINVFPMPASVQLNISFEATQVQDLQYSLISMSGQVVIQKSTMANTGRNLFSLDVAPLKSGIYFLSIRNNDQNIIQKVIVK